MKGAEHVPLKADPAFTPSLREVLFGPLSFSIPTGRNMAEGVVSSIRELLAARGLSDEELHSLEIILEEAIANGQEHVYGFAEEETFPLYLFITGDEQREYIHLAFGYGGRGFDARRVRLTCRNPDGTVYLGTRGRGHIFLSRFANQAVYLNEGRDLHLILYHPRDTFDRVA